MLYKSILISLLCMFFSVCIMCSDKNPQAEDFALLSPHRSGFQPQQPKKITLRLNEDSTNPGSFEVQSGSESDDPDPENILITVTLRSRGSKRINVDQEKFAKALKEFKQAVDKATDIDEEAKKPGENVFALKR